MATLELADVVGPTWTLEMRDDGGSTEDVEFDHKPTRHEIDEACEEWAKGGDWGEDGAAVDVMWDLLDSDGDKIDSGSYEVDIEPDHDALIAAAGGDTDCDHKWTAEGEGGCTENPGVWSVGGTAMTFATHCRKCGLHRVEHHTGSQRNPGEHDTVTYKQPASWCAKCECEECECEEEEQEEIMTVGEYKAAHPECTGDICDHEGTVLDDDDTITVREGSKEYCFGESDSQSAWISFE